MEVDVSRDGEITKPSRMRAQPDDPFLGVYVLTEFIFCPRAGVIAHEAGQDESAEDLGPVKLDYMPEYDLHEIERALQELKGQLWLWGIGVVAALFLTGVVTYTVHPESLWIGLAVVAGIVYKMMRLFSRAWVLAGRQWACLHAEPKEPDPTATEVQPVNWWELMKAGFRSIKYQDGLTDEGLDVVRATVARAPPWLAADTRVPRCCAARRNSIVSTTPRMAAYCHLLEVREGGESPYGIILFGHYLRGRGSPQQPDHQGGFP